MYRDPTPAFSFFLQISRLQNLAQTLQLFQLRNLTRPSALTPLSIVLVDIIILKEDDNIDQRTPLNECPAEFDKNQMF